MTIPTIGDYLDHVPASLLGHRSKPPWKIADEISTLLTEIVGGLSRDFEVEGAVAIHHTASVHPSAVITESAIVDKGGVVGPHCRLREGVYLGQETRLGASSEVKSSWVHTGSALGHLNYVGNSVIGEDVNLEAGVVVANHFNERANKLISVLVNGNLLATELTRFGAAIGSGSKIGANAVTSPGTLLPKGSVVGRLELVNQLEATDNSDIPPV